MKRWNSSASFKTVWLLRYTSIPYSVLAISLFLTFVGWSVAETYYENQTQKLFTIQVENSLNRIKHRMHSYEYSLQALLGFMNASDNVTAQDWHDFTQTLSTLQYYPGLQGLGYAVMLHPDEVEKLEKTMSEKGAFSLYPKGERPLYSAIIYLEPKNERNRVAMGFDMYSDPVRRQAMDTARDTGKITLSGGVTLVQETEADIQPGILMYAPFYKRGSEHRTVQQRRETLQGFVYSPFRMNDLLDEVLPHDEGMDFQIYDVTGEPTFLYRSYDASKAADPHTDTRWIKICGRIWRIDFSHKDQYTSQRHHNEPDIFAVFALVFDFLIFGLLRYLVRSRKEIDDVAKELKKNFDWLNNILDSSTDGVHILNSDGNLVAWSRSFLEMLGYTAQEASTLNILNIDTIIDAGKIVEELKNFPIGEQRVLVTRHRRKDGSEIDVEITMRVFEIEGERYWYSSSRDISQRKEVERAIIKEKELAQRYLDIVDVMILVLDKDKNVQLINRKGCEIIGYPPEEVIGKNWMEHFIPKRLRHQVHEVGDTLMKSHSDSINYYENPILTKNKEERLISWHNTTLLDQNGNTVGILTSGEDITQRKIVENELIRLSQVVNQNPYPTIITDIDGKIEYVNPAGIEASGYSKRELVGKKMAIFSSGEHSKEFYEKLWKTIKHDQQSWQGTLIDKMKNGEIKDCKSIIFPIFDNQNRLVNFVSIKEDITERNLKDKLFMMQTRQAQMGEMIAMIAHQWRQPLATINAIAGKIRFKEAFKEEEDPEIIEEAKKIEEQSLHLSNTITDFKDIFRPDKPKESISLSSIVKNAINLIDHSIKSHGVDLKIIVNHDPKVETFSNELLQVIMTLIKNSLDAFDEKRIAKPGITIRVDQTQGYGTIALQDNGGGIKAGIMKEIFLPYFTTKKMSHGTGLGLYMSKMIIEEHCQGKIDVESDQESVTTFTISLPLGEELL